MSSTTAASVALWLGTTSPRSFFCLAAEMATDSAPLAGRVEPSSESSPTTAYSSNRRASNCPLPARMPSVIGRSNVAACLGISAGARLMTIRSLGRLKPELTIARATRCVLSRIAGSGRPTSTVAGRAPAETSTSTSTGTASIPKSEKVCRRASIGAFSGVAAGLCRPAPRRAPSRRPTGANCTPDHAPPSRGGCQGRATPSQSAEPIRTSVEPSAIAAR